MRISFDKVVELLEEYKSEHGDLLVPMRYRTVEEKAKLEEISFVWKVR